MFKLRNKDCTKQETLFFFLPVPIVHCTWNIKSEIEKLIPYPYIAPNTVNPEM